MHRVFEKEKNVDLYIHLGDGERDTAGFHNDIPFKEHYCVRGNCDSGYTPTEKFFSAAGKKLFITHGHLYDVKTGLERLTQRAVELKADIVLYGHTHEGLETYDTARKIHFLNPGSISLPKHGKPPTYGVVEILGGKTVVSVVKLRTGLFK
jgi:putative phosphoesterase